MKVYRNKPGLFYRAVAAFVLLNIATILTLLATWWLSGGMASPWQIRGLLAVAVAVAEFSIVTTTIGPPLMDWIKSQECVEEEKQP